MTSQLDNLTSQFNILLNEYQNISKQYTNLMNQKDISLTKIPNNAFIGKNNLNVLADSNVSNCETACSENTSCSGATFNTNLKNCSLYSDNGDIIPSENSVAIVKKAIYYSNQLKELNSKMSNLNNHMMTISNENYNQYHQNKEVTAQQEVIIVNNNDILKKERGEIDIMLKQFDTLNAAYEDGNIMVNANYLNYIIFLFIVLFLIVLLFTFSISGNQSGGGNRKMNNSMVILLTIFVFTFIVIFFSYAK